MRDRRGGYTLLPCWPLASAPTRQSSCHCYRACRNSYEGPCYARAESEAPLMAPARNDNNGTRTAVAATRAEPEYGVAQCGHNEGFAKATGDETVNPARELRVIVPG